MAFHIAGLSSLLGMVVLSLWAFSAMAFRGYAMFREPKLPVLYVELGLAVVATVYAVFLICRWVKGVLSC
jgi:hypothetical protein